MGQSGAARAATPGQAPAQGAFDVVVIGGGVFGLWVAVRALEAGASVAILERARVGAGASGGQLGALTAHTPDRWSPKKAFQLDALLALPGAIAALEAATGHDVGFARTGRVIPIRRAGFLDQLPAREAGAARWWMARDPSLVYQRRGLEAVEQTWLDPGAAPLGVIWDGLAARLDPKRYLGALAARARGLGGRLIHGAAHALVPGGVRLASGERLRAAAVVVAAGWESFELLERLSGAPLGAHDRGSGVKGQSLRLAPSAPVPPDAPILYDDSVYVIAHARGGLAVGATSRAAWDGAPNAPDPSDVGFLERAAALCPAVRGAAIVGWWAGVRPKRRTRDPLLGPIAPPIGGRPALWAATGGFKIGFGIAHHAAAVVVDRLLAAASPTPAPAAFLPVGADGPQPTSAEEARDDA